MTEKRFTIDVLDENNWLIQDTKTGENANPIDGTTNVLKGLISTLNKFNDENEQLKFKLEEVKSDEKQLEISFMEFKMKLIEKLQIHYDYATEQRQKNLNDIFVAKAYDIIRYDIKKLAEEMRVDLCELLNELHDEKESWRKSWIEELNDSEEQSKCIIKLANENEELKKEIQNLQAKLNILEQAITGDNKQ